MSVSGPAVLLVGQSKSQVLGGRVTIQEPNGDVKLVFAKALLGLQISINPQSGPIAHQTRENSRITPLEPLRSPAPKGHQRPR